ncbi:transcriptional regulator with XRE-family HTH domain [Conyzicola lurida]|uniref:Transcriptional regulator with XRE-family HTH domain n=1 Tax=Conyzicola lurida TaxID=1172621 RepID=A0A841APX9_9MICO|nr:helix-turn-helix transcriptional regulator [Conyzicola lurida]MBB5844012.1 transcriptional regulator with XRE-family HTH domain [Conyzicola lurida]
MAEKINTLGAYLRARRDAVTAEQAGISDEGVRRVPGLRREEVAMLAGISADYYLRLEQGKDRNPSVQVLESIARVLGLDDDHRAHLLALGAPVPRRNRRRPQPETVPDGVSKLLHSLTQPAFIEGRYFDILASNHLAQSLDPALTVGRNQLRDLFLDPGTQTAHPDWPALTECLVASLRQAVGTDIDDPRFIELTGELSLGSDRFRKLWARHDVITLYGGTEVRIDHPEIGGLTVNRERLAIGGTNGLTLVVYHPDARSDSDEKLALLASARATAVRPDLASAMNTLPTP